MREIAKQVNDVTIFENGEAFISIRKMESLLGLGTGTINKYLSRQHPNYLSLNGLSVEMVELVSTYYAFDTANPTQAARDFVKLVVKAGAKAYLYHEAGYVYTAKPTAQQRDVRLDEKARAVEVVARMLNFSESAKVTAIATIIPELRPMLPTYVIDKSSTSV